MTEITHGMNIEEVERLARDLRNLGDELDRIGARLDRKVSRARWEGSTGRRFKGEWWPAHRATITRTAADLRGFGESALRNAGDQRDASSAGSSDGGSKFEPCRLGFADRVRSNVPGPQDLVLAKLNAGQVPADWEELDPERDDKELRKRGIDPALLSSRDGFAARLYKSRDDSVVLVFGGTKPTELADWKNNAQQFVGLGASQYHRAVELARVAKAAFGDDLVVTGHSLGGGLASLAAVATGTPGVTFNPAALSDNTLIRAGLNPNAARSLASGLVHSYTVEFEILDVVQQPAFPLVNTLGTSYSLDGLSWQGELLDVFNPIPGAMDNVNAHLLEYILGSMEDDPRFAGD